MSASIYYFAVRLFEQERFAQAYRLTAYGLRENPEDGQLWELKGMIHHVQNEHSECIDALQTAARFTCLKPVCRSTLADGLARTGRINKARRHYMAVFDDPGLSVTLLPYVATGLAYIQEWNLCATVCRHWCKTCPDLSEPALRLAFALGNSGADVQEVTDVAWHSVALSRDRLNTRVSIAILLMNMNQGEEAYRFVCSLLRYDLNLIGCGCALEILQDIYTMADDSVRSAWCREIIRTAAEHNPDGSTDAGD